MILHNGRVKVTVTKVKQSSWEMKTEIDTIDSVLFDHPSGHEMASKIVTRYSVFRMRAFGMTIMLTMKSV